MPRKFKFKWLVYPPRFDSPNGGTSPLVKATNPRDLHMCLQLNLSTKSNTLNLKINQKGPQLFFFFIVSVICLKEGKIQVT